MPDWVSELEVDQQIVNQGIGYISSGVKEIGLNRVKINQRIKVNSSDPDTVEFARWAAGIDVGKHMYEVLGKMCTYFVMSSGRRASTQVQLDR